MRYERSHFTAIHNECQILIGFHFLPKDVFRQPFSEFVLIHRFMMNGKGEILNKLTKDVEKNGEKIKDLEVSFFNFFKQIIRKRFFIQPLFKVCEVMIIFGNHTSFCDLFW